MGSELNLGDTKYMKKIGKNDDFHKIEFNVTYNPMQDALSDICFVPIYPYLKK